MASFSNRAKTEICASVRTEADKRAFLTGVLLGARRFSADEIVLQTECEAFAALLPALWSKSVPRLVCDTEFRTRSGKAPLWIFTISGRKQIAALTEALQIDPECRAAVPGSSSNLQMLAAGAFVVCGSVTDPKRGYHLEMAFQDAEIAHALREALAGLEQPSVQMKETGRKSERILYLKQNEQIGDVLAFFGANEANFEMIGQQVIKSVISQTVRRMNCDMANIEKTVSAGLKQAEEIRRIAETQGLDSLPETLQETARMRLAEPEANLRDLGAMLHPPLTRSGVYHRMQRLMEIAARIKKD